MTNVKRWYQRAPYVKFGEESDSEVKRRTNFSSDKEMIAYTILICNADWEVMCTSRSGILTWYEEWFFFYEFCWGRTLTRWIDVSSPKHYGISKWRMIDVFDHKLSIALRARKSWPKYATFEEDCMLRKEKWNLKYGK